MQQRNLSWKKLVSLENRQFSKLLSNWLAGLASLQVGGWALPLTDQL